MVEDWTEKYRPRSLREVVGNGKAVDTIRRWAESWVDGEPKEKALILAGEPGVGKTSAAHALAADFNWGVLELNASDARNRETIEAVALTGSINETFTASGEFRPMREGGRKLIILDEADNLYERLAGGGGGRTRQRVVRTGEGDGGWETEKVKESDMSDRGGKAAIINTIRNAHQPVILIVNDLYALTKGSGAALRSLCVTVKFSRIRDSTVGNTLAGICRAEGITADPEALDIIARNAGGDLRSAVNDLQAAALGRTELTADDVSHLSERDSRPGTFDAVAGVLSSATFADAREAADNIDESPEQFILWIDENLPRVYLDPGDRVRGFDSLSRADTYLYRSRRTQVYRFWAYARDMMTAGVALARQRGSGRGGGRLNFPQYLMKMSRSKGQRALRDSASLLLGRYTHTSVLDTRVNYLHQYKFLLKSHRPLSVRIARTTRMDPGVLAYLLDTKPTTVKVKDIIREAAEVDLGGDGPSISLGRAYEDAVDEDDEGEEGGGGGDTRGKGGKTKGKKQAKGRGRAKRGIVDPSDGEGGDEDDGAVGGSRGDEEDEDGDEDRDTGEEGKEEEEEGKGKQKSLFDY